MKQHAFRYGNRMMITGGGSGIGKSCARLFAELGYEVFAVSRQVLESSVQRGQGNIHSVRMDVTDDESVRRAMSLIGPVDIVVHCAGIGIAGSAEDTPLDDARAQMETNYFGVLRVNQAALPGMRERRRGLVIIVGSVAGRLGIPFQSHYSSTKAALERYAEAMRAELWPYGVNVCVLEPGDTKSGFTAARRMCFPARSPYLERGIRSVQKMARDEEKGKPCRTVAQAALRVVNRRRPPMRRAVGAGYLALLFIRRLLPDSLVAWIVGKVYAR